MDNYRKAITNQIMWWPINQTCLGCKHQQQTTLQQMQDLDMFPNAVEDDSGITGIQENEAPLAYHGSTCGKKQVRGELGTGIYECTLHESFE